MRCEFQDDAVTGLSNAGRWEIRERLPQRQQKFAKKKFAVPAFQPELVVMDDDYSLEHRLETIREMSSVYSVLFIA
jgi:hypothetical protein